MEFKEKMVSDDGQMFIKKIVEELSDPSTDNDKAKARLAIQNQVFDLYDSVADNAKMISLLTGVVAQMYSMMSEEQKASISVEYRGMIEHTFTKFAGTQTRADVQFGSEGLAMIDKLLDRQGAIGTIVGGI